MYDGPLKREIRGFCATKNKSVLYFQKNLANHCLLWSVIILNVLKRRVMVGHDIRCNGLPKMCSLLFLRIVTIIKTNTRPC